ncbi:MAG: SPOR domain-containing protein [Candidatus Omnitrophota bacterium]|nr:MAG: SPOR domain-containing protein [Candidatus Omnitrophota bacterium]
MRKLQITNYKLQILLLAICCLLLVTLDVHASETTDSVWSYFLKCDYKKAISEANKAEEARAHYIMGLSYIKLGKPSHAREHFRFILDMYPLIDVKEEIILSIADSYFLEGDFQKAATEYTNFLKNFQSSGLRSLAYLRLGQSQRRLGHWSAAKVSLSKVVEDFPYSFERKEAQKELLKEFYYYVQAGSFSRKTNAAKLQKTLVKKGFDSYINRTVKDNRTFYRVCTGKFENREDATYILRELKANGYSGRIYP